MWLYVPPNLLPTSPHSQELERSISPSEEFFRELEHSCTWRGKSRQSRLWRLAWKRANWMPLRFGATFGQSQQGHSEAVSIWWSVAFPARTSPAPGSEQESSENGLDSSSISLQSFATWEPATSSWRTLQLSLFEASTPFSGRWPKSGSMRSWAVSRRQTLVRLMAATGGGVSHGTGGSWPTPHGFNGQETDGSYGTGGEFEKFCKQWATPSAKEWRFGDASDATMERNARPLNEQASHWPTPNTVDARDGRNATAGRTDPNSKHHSGTTLSDAIRIHQDQQTERDGQPTSQPTQTSRLQLNPRFVEALMGLRPGWTDFEDSATPSCPIRLNEPCAASGIAPSESGCHE
jgi:hypothetical protein